MKVLHICTFDHGGAANAALKLHKGLLSENIQSKFLSLFPSKPDIPASFGFSKNPVFHSIPLRLWRRIQFREINYKKKTIESKMAKENKTSTYEGFSIPLSDFALEKHPLVQEADIVHLHWVSNFLDFPTFFTKTNKPIVWTLHDMNPFQGGFHYLYDKTTYQEHWGDLEQKLMQIKREAILGANVPIHIVTPSKWLGEASQNSEVLGHLPHHHIFYGVDTSVFYPEDKEKVRKELGLPNKPTLLFISEKIDSYRKGADLLEAAIEGLGKDYHIIAVGNPPPVQEQNRSIHYLGRVNNASIMRKLYNASDMFVLPSREDNLPNVMLESLACGIPVVSFEVGGMKDVIKDGENGFLAKPATSKGLASTIIKAINHTFDKEGIKNNTVKNFSLAHQAYSYTSLYIKQIGIVESEL